MNIHILIDDAGNIVGSLVNITAKNIKDAIMAFYGCNSVELKGDFSRSFDGKIKFDQRIQNKEFFLTESSITDASMVKILVEVEGGLVTKVHCNSKAQIVVVDHDNIQGDENCVSGINDPDTITQDMYTLFTDKTDPKIMETRDELKSMKF